MLKSTNILSELTLLIARIAPLICKREDISEKNVLQSYLTLTH